jgi:hypothetical protein
MQIAPARRHAGHLDCGCHGREDVLARSVDIGLTEEEFGGREPYRPE